MGVESPTMIGAFDVLSIELAAVQRHATVGTGVAQREGVACTVASDNERNLEQHGFVELVAVDAVGGQGPIPEAGEHERVGRLALERVEFGHGRKLLIVDF